MDGTNWVWVVVFIPGQNGDYPSVCLPQDSHQTTTTTTTKKPFHDHLHDVHWALPGLFPPVDPFLQSFHSSLLYEPLLGWFRSDSRGNVKKKINKPNYVRILNLKYNQEELRKNDTNVKDPVNQKSIQYQKRNIKRIKDQNNLKGKPRITLTLGNFNQAE